MLNLRKHKQTLGLRPKLRTLLEVKNHNLDFISAGQQSQSKAESEWVPVIFLTYEERGCLQKLQVIDSSESDRMKKPQGDTPTVSRMTGWLRVSGFTAMIHLQPSLNSYVE